MKYWNKITAVLCCVEAVAQGFTAYTEHSVGAAVLAVLWLNLAVGYVTCKKKRKRKMGKQKCKRAKAIERDPQGGTNEIP